MRRILGHYVATSTLVLGIFEVMLIVASCGVAMYYYSFSRSYPAELGVGIVPIAILTPLVIVGLLHSGGLYDVDALVSLRRTLWRLGLITVPIFALAVWTTGQLAKHGAVPIYPYRWQWTIALTIVWLASAIVLRALLGQIHRNGWLTRRVLFVGGGRVGVELSDLAKETHGRFLVVDRLEVSADNAHAPARSRLVELAVEKRVPEIVVACDGQDRVPWKVLADCRLDGIKITDFLDFYERESGRICIEALRDDWIALASGFELRRGQDRTMRIFDVVFSALALIATAPVMLLTALAIKIEDGGSVLYSQERVGLGGRKFVVFKFRSMREDAERDGIPAWAAERDCRVTRVGRVIRKLRIDELPQFLNVLRGDMAIIGPRPERPYFVTQFSECIPFYQYRHAVRPGITGWAQVKFRYGASLDDTRRKFSYDLFYVKNRGLLLNFVIVLKTIGVVLRGEGAR